MTHFTDVVFQPGWKPNDLELIYAQVPDADPLSPEQNTRVVAMMRVDLANRTGMITDEFTRSALAMLANDPTLVGI